VDLAQSARSAIGLRIVRPAFAIKSFRAVGNVGAIWVGAARVNRVVAVQAQGARAKAQSSAVPAWAVLPAVAAAILGVAAVGPLCRATPGPAVARHKAIAPTRARIKSTHALLIAARKAFARSRAHHRIARWLVIPQPASTIALGVAKNCAKTAPIVPVVATGAVTRVVSVRDVLRRVAVDAGKYVWLVPLVTSPARPDAISGVWAPRV